ncbi:Thioredoxin-M [Jannaschia seosinensis]|uniref:Thioredoxin-M n=1 Tax=Jannaschia seosinensis TaxID=313367 RepID=A0A0M7BE72_9RHOB|nr:tetratricopeptide repeat protein [Jannaschia seosinensis]CUH40691.1 Thioredoxin-M [Jannaschia seosinensis]
MLELGQTQQPAAPNDLIRDVTEATFMAEVVEASMTVPVIVDFWAPWCGPCKTLGPQLEQAVTDAKGLVRMAKVDVDGAQQIAQQLRIQSIPTVYAFWQGQPVDGFQGAISQAEVKAFVDRVAAMNTNGVPGDDGLGEALAAAEEMLAEGAAMDAGQTFAAIIGEDPENAAAHGGLIRAHIALGEFDQAEGHLLRLTDEVAKAPEVEAARAQLALAQQAANAGPVAELQAAVEADPDNHQARFDLAAALQGAGDLEGAVDHLLELFRRDRDWNDGAARAQLFTLFEAAGPKDPVAQRGRRKLSSMIFV